MHVWQHFKTITKHKLLVTRYCFKIGLYWQGLVHDLSKYSWTEFSSGCKYYQGDRSPNNAEREATGISRSWLHHKGRNKHHFEYWIDYSVDKKCPTVIEGMRMPKKYVAEMVMDRICACRVYKGSRYTSRDPLEYFMNSREHLWFVHPEVKKELEFLLTMLAEKGEEETLHYIRSIFLNKQDEFGKR